MSWLCEPSVLRREMYALAREAGGWDDRESKSRMQAVFSRAHAAARGETVEWQGLQVDSRYRFRSQTIMELLEITAQEEGAMRTLISPDEERRRDRERKQKERREAGMKDRAAAAAARTDTQVRQLHEQGRSTADIAVQVGVSERHVRRLLARPDMSVRLYGGVASAEGG